MHRRTPPYLPDFLARSRAFQGLLGLLLAALLAFAGAKTAGVVSASAATTPSTAPSQYNTPQYDNPQCVVTDQGNWELNQDGELVNTTNPNWAYSCSWTVPHDPNNPSVFTGPTWQGCQYWAVEKRPDIYTNVIAPSGDWMPEDWPALARQAGYAISTTPAVGDLVIWTAAQTGQSGGHVAYVTSINSDGTFVASEMNPGTSETQTMHGDSVLEQPGNVNGVSYIEPPGGATQPLPTHGQTTTTSPSKTAPGGSTTPTSGSKPAKQLRKTKVTVSHQIKRGTLTVRIRETGLASVNAKATWPHRATRKLRYSHKRGSSLMTLQAKLPRGTWKITVSFKQSKGWTAVKARSFNVRVTFA